MFRALLAILLIVTPSLAIAGSRVVVLEPASPDALLAEALVRLRAELASAGFDVASVPSDQSQDVRKDLEQGRPGPTPAVTLAIRRAEGAAAIDVWVADRVSGKTSVRRIDAQASSDMVPSALAIRVVELLRASLLETTLPDRAPSEKVPADLSALLPRRVESSPSHGRALALGAGVVQSFAGLGPAIGPVVRLSADVHSRFALRLDVVGPVFGGALEAEAGTASVRQELATLGVIARASLGETIGYFNLGLGGYHLHARGEAKLPNAGKGAEVWAGVGVVGAGVALRIGKSMEISAELDALVTFPGVAVALDGVIAARAGRPSLVASLGPSWTF